MHTLNFLSITNKEIGYGFSYSHKTYVDTFLPSRESFVPEYLYPPGIRLLARIHHYPHVQIIGQ